MLKSLLFLEKMHLDDTIVFTSINFDKYQDQLDNLRSMCLADFASSHVSKKVGHMSVGPDEVKRYTLPKSNINNVECHPNIIALKNELGEMRKYIQH